MSAAESHPPRVTDAATHDEIVRAVFDAEAERWEGYYHDASLDGLIYRRRQETALRWVDSLSLPPGAPALDAGCGAGELTAALAARGLEVDAVDAAPRMVARVAERGLPRVRATMALADQLPFPAESFDVVVALGLLPWVEDPAAVVAELARVLRPGGHAVLTVDNARRLTYALDPRMSSAARVVKRCFARWRGTTRLHSLADPESFHALVDAAGLAREASAGVGFGPFTLMAHRVLPTRVGIALDERLQARADRGGALATRAVHYLVLARKA